MRILIPILEAVFGLAIAWVLIESVARSTLTGRRVLRAFDIDPDDPEAAAPSRRHP
jgi:hypothetical protein